MSFFMSTFVEVAKVEISPHPKFIFTKKLTGACSMFFMQTMNMFFGQP